MARQPIQVAVYCVRSRGSHWEFLLLHRVLDRLSFWQAVTGGVEDDEDYYAAALRELNEETGFEPIDLEMIDYSYVFPVQEEMRRIYEKPVDYITEIVFLARVGCRGSAAAGQQRYRDNRGCGVDGDYLKQPLFEYSGFHFSILSIVVLFSWFRRFFVQQAEVPHPVGAAGGPARHGAMLFAETESVGALCVDVHLCGDLSSA